jgi:carbamoylphosphate synthase large subunit
MQPPGSALPVAELDKALRQGARILRVVVVEMQPATDCRVYLLLADQVGWQPIADRRGRFIREWAQPQRLLAFLRSRTSAEICFHPAWSDTLAREGIQAR